MIGYVESADNNGDYRKIQITMLHADDFELAKFGCETEVYTVDRFSEELRAINSDIKKEGPSPGFVQKIINVLKLYECTQKIALCVMWKSVGDNGVEFAGFKPLEKVWLPIPVTNELFRGACINVTKLFFTKTPKPLEASFVCDILNLLVSHSGAIVSNPFCCCVNSVFCDIGFMQVLKTLFKKSFLETKIMKHVRCDLVEKGELKRAVKTKVSPNEISLSFSKTNIQPTKYDGTEQYFVVGLKRDCIAALISETVLCLEKGFGLDRLMRHNAKYIREALKKLRSLCTILVARGHIGKLSDINYLSFYELLEAFAFQEKSLELKTTVRQSEMTYRILRGVDIPDYISSDKSLVYI